MAADDMLDDLAFTEKLGSMPDRKLLEFVATQVHDMSQICPIHGDDILVLSTRLNTLENVEKTTSKKTIGVAGSVGGGITLLVGTLIAVILKKLFGIDITSIV